jgi:hypothetical protein
VENEPAAEEEDAEVLSEREPEAHDNYEASDVEDKNEESVELYDPNEIREIEINIKNKASTLKKVILDSIKLNKKANIVLFKEDTTGEKNPEGKNWVEFSQEDLDQNVKSLAGQTIAFRVYMEIRVRVDGRGQSFQSLLQVDPKDQLDVHMKKNTHFWKQFMAGSSPKCLMMVQNKGQDEGEVILPENFGKDFITNNILDKAQVTLYEISKIP